MTEISNLLGKILESCEIFGGHTPNADGLRIAVAGGSVFELAHVQDCCEDVRLVDVCGDLDDLVGYPIAQAEVAHSDAGEVMPESSTWTFYKLGTVMGCVTLRFLGRSNGYYSETADFYQVKGRV